MSRTRMTDAMPLAQRDWLGLFIDPVTAALVLDE